MDGAKRSGAATFLACTERSLHNTIMFGVVKFHKVKMKFEMYNVSLSGQNCKSCKMSNDLRDTCMG